MGAAIFWYSRGQNWHNPDLGLNLDVDRDERWNLRRPQKPNQGEYNSSKQGSSQHSPPVCKSGLFSSKVAGLVGVDYLTPLVREI